ncbi:MAG: cytochrome c3 family protein [Proteobacteria bacterium]|nr:cytochrome c3 family protein [Pseudomonadota bacterium]
MRGRTLLIAGLLTAAFAGQAAAQTLGTITRSPHDLSASGVLNNEICVYCHTPHGTTNDDGPLWNRLATVGPFVAYDSSTLDGSILGKSGANFDPGEVSMACLSCHDGTQALDAVINSPGRGLGTPLAGAAMTAGIAVVGPDLSNDHPISIQYGGYDSGSGVIDEDFVDNSTVTATTGLNTATINGTPAWWVNTSVGGTIGRDKEDMILYTAGAEPYVECATCHDPHSGNVADPLVEVNFLRMTNAGSAICLACHVK